MGDIDLKVISAIKSSNKFQKTRFCKEKLVKDTLNVYHSIQVEGIVMFLDVVGKILTIQI